jgi:hypothetical protein
VSALAQADRRSQRVARAAVVPGDLVRSAQALVDLGGLRGQLVLERQRQAGPDDLDARLVRAALGAGDAFEPHGAGAQVGSIRTHRLCGRHVRGLRRFGMQAGAVEKISFRLPRLLPGR